MAMVFMAAMPAAAARPAKNSMGTESAGPQSAWEAMKARCQRCDNEPGPHGIARYQVARGYNATGHYTVHRAFTAQVGVMPVKQHGCGSQQPKEGD